MSFMELICLERDLESISAGIYAEPGDTVNKRGAVKKSFFRQIKF